MTGRYWETVERLKINQFYSAPTAIRLLLKYGDEWVRKYDRSSLKTLGSGASLPLTAVWLWSPLSALPSSLSDVSKVHYVKFFLKSY